ncbi:MAG: ATP-dependent nuclease [Methanobacteriaceae archaeon]
MEIKELYLENFKSFEKCTINFDDFYTAICGKNNSGKSNIIKSIFKVLNQHSFRESFLINDFPIWKKNKEDEISIIKIKLFLRKDSDLGILKFFKMILFEEKNKYVAEVDDTLLEISICQENKITKTIVMIDGVEIQDKYLQREILRKLNPDRLIIFHNSTNLNPNSFHRYKGSRKRYHGELESLSNQTRDSIDKKVVKIEELLLSINNELSNSIQENKSKLEDLIHMLHDKHDLTLNFSNADININTDYGKVPYEILLGEEDYKLSLENWGSGTQNRTLILNSIFHAKNVIEQDDESKVTPLLIIEEPESFLHPSAQADFGRILQDLSKELEIQVIVTTHSPYLLSHYNPNSNILIKRMVVDENLRESYIEEIDNENWKEPFELALGMAGPEFDTLKKAFFSENNSIMLVEGEIDVEYFELMRHPNLGKNKLDFEGEIYPCGGFSTLNNNALMKFFKERFKDLIITFDLDAYNKVEKSLNGLGFARNKDFFSVGIDKGGLRRMEGLLPDIVKDNVYKNNGDLVEALQSDDKDEVKSSKNRLKKLFLDEFKKENDFTEEYFENFNYLIQLINKRSNDA